MIHKWEKTRLFFLIICVGFSWLSDGFPQLISEDLMLQSIEMRYDEAIQKKAQEIDLLRKEQERQGAIIEELQAIHAEQVQAKKTSEQKDEKKETLLKNVPKKEAQKVALKKSEKAPVKQAQKIVLKEPKKVSFSPREAVLPEKKSSLAALARADLSEPRIHILLVAFDRSKNMWNLLLGWEKEKGKGVWSDISRRITGSNIFSLVADEISKETGKEIMISSKQLSSAPQFTMQNDDEVYIIPVSYKHPRVLNAALKKQGKARKGQLVWYPIDDIKNANGELFIRLGYGNGLYDAPLLDETRQIIEEFWNEAEQEVSSLKSQSLTSKPQATMALPRAAEPSLQSITASTQKQTASQPAVFQKPQIAASQPNQHNILLLEKYLLPYENTVYADIQQPPYHIPFGGWEQLRNSPQAIFFYHSHNPYYEFTNFYRPAPFVAQGIHYPTSEHYFQAQKFIGNTAVQQYIAAAPTPRDAYDRAKGSGGGNLFISDQYKVTIMFQALVYKFLQNPKLLDVLLQTKGKVLIEDTGAAILGPKQHDDPFWGNGKSGMGKNYLGRLLMYIRDLVLAAEASA